MYLGRDREYDKYKTPDENYEEYFSYLKNHGTKDKGIEANQMTEKVPLGKYLRNGLEILEVTSDDYHQDLKTPK